ncbi:MAG: hypothetical protein JO168_16985 [Solirubrobacterales bacterium]|nr:hypothetical protein [Solirubrobacterales bacterium]
MASTVGLVLGGMFAGWLSWRVGFFINLPIGITVMRAAPRYLPETTPHRGQADAAGAVASTLGMRALVYGIMHSADAGWGNAVTLLAVAAGALLLGLFVANAGSASERPIPGSA